MNGELSNKKNIKKIYDENIILVAVEMAQNNTNTTQYKLRKFFIHLKSITPHHISVEFLSLPLNTHPVQSKDFVDLSDPVGAGCFDCFSAKNRENAR